MTHRWSWMTATSFFLLLAPGAIGQSNADAQNAAAAPDPWKSIEPQNSSEDRVISRGGRGASETAKVNAPSSSGGPTWSRTLVSLAAVVALIVLLAWGYRRVAAGNLGPLAPQRRPGMIQIVSRCVVSPRQSLCLVRVGPRLVLVGVSPEQMNALDVIADADLTAQLAGAARATTRDSAATEFDASLKLAEQTFDGPETDAAPRGMAAIAAAMQRLRGLARA